MFHQLTNAVRRSLRVSVVFLVFWMGLFFLEDHYVQSDFFDVHTDHGMIIFTSLFLVGLGYQVLQKEYGYLFFNLVSTPVLLFFSILFLLITSS